MINDNPHSAFKSWELFEAPGNRTPINMNQSCSAEAPLPTEGHHSDTHIAVQDDSEETVRVSELNADGWEHLRDIRLRALTDAPDNFASSLARERKWNELHWRERFTSSRWLVACPGETLHPAALLGLMPPHKISPTHKTNPTHEANPTHKTNPPHKINHTPKINHPPKTDATDKSNAPSHKSLFPGSTHSTIYDSQKNATDLQTAKNSETQMDKDLQMEKGIKQEQEDWIDRWTVHSLWVDPGQRRGGVASLLMKQAHHLVQELGGQRLVLWVARGNRAAESLYARLGYLPTGQTQPAPSSGSRQPVHSNVLMPQLWDELILQFTDAKRDESGQKR